ILLKAFLNDPVIRKRFLREVEGRVEWDKSYVKTYVNKAAHFDLLLLICIGIMCGAPIRIAELAAMQYRNTDLRTRNFFVLANFVAVLGQYHKSAKLFGYDKFIPHALDAVTADLMLRNLVYVRPM
ncbi:hypothetical protein FISHEDRAFT_12953, partial [Fistulina hepatica ATCC 64428]